MARTERFTCRLRRPRALPTSRRAARAVYWTRVELPTTWFEEIRRAHKHFFSSNHGEVARCIFHY